MEVASGSVAQILNSSEIRLEKSKLPEAKAIWKDAPS